MPRIDSMTGKCLGTTTATNSANAARFFEGAGFPQPAPPPRRSGRGSHSWPAGGLQAAGPCACVRPRQPVRTLGAGLLADHTDHGPPASMARSGSVARVDLYSDDVKNGPADHGPL